MSRTLNTISRRGFTVIELLVVIGIIVLALGLAVPAFKSLSGSNGEASAANQISAILGRARSEAINAQHLRGVFFYPDATSGRYVATIVYSPAADQAIDDFKPGQGHTYLVGQYVKYSGNFYCALQDTTDATTPIAMSATDVNWRQTHDESVIDAVLPAEDSVTLAANVGVQVICDSRITAGAPPTKTSDNYLRCGAVFFDGGGSLVMNHQISICSGGVIGQRMGLNAAGIAAGTLFYYPDPVKSQCYTVLSGGIPKYPYESSCGFVLYDREALMNQPFFSENDFWVVDPRSADSRYAVPSQASEIGTTTGVAPVSEEDWLDKNGAVFLINRYNGSLIKGQ